MHVAGRLYLIFLMGLLISSAAAGLHPPCQQYRSRLESSTAPAPARRALGCLLSHAPVVHILADLRLKPGDTAAVRYYVGTIPGLGPTPGEFSIAVYEPGEEQGELLIAIPTGRGRFLPVANGYHLRKLRHGWQADEGNGGLATYAAVSRFAAWLVQHWRSYRVRVTPHREYCSGPME